MSGFLHPAASSLLHALGWTLLHFCWQGVIVATLLWSALGLLRGSQLRYGIACCALLAMIALPLATFLYLISTSQDSVALMHAPRALWFPQIGSDGNPSGTGEPWLSRIAFTLDHSLSWVIVLWSAGVLVFLTRLAFGLIAARRMKSASTQPVSSDLQSVLQNLCRRLGIVRVVCLMNSALVQVPTVIGWLRPVILLPASCLSGLSPSQIEALLAHELAHIQRHDYFVSVFQSVVEALLFYHPAVWWVSSQLRREREHCCDDLAVSVGGNSLALATALSYLAQQRASIPEISLAANGGVLTMRIRRLLGYEQNSAISYPAAVAVLALVVTSVAVCFGTLARAQSNPAVEQRVIASAQTERSSVSKPSALAISNPVPSANVNVASNSTSTTNSSLREQTLPSSDESPSADAHSGGSNGSPEPFETGHYNFVPVQYRQWLNEDVVWIIAPEERTAFLSLTHDEERDHFIEQFWQRRGSASDPTGTRFREEHYRRIAYANVHFATSAGGWKTDRGHIYIAYGNPDSIDSHPNGTNGSPEPFETWHYKSAPGLDQNADFKFVDLCHCGNYRYQSPPKN